MSYQANLIRFSSLTVDILIILAFFPALWLFRKPTQRIDFRDRLLLAVAFMTAVVHLAMLAAIECVALRLGHRMMQILIELTMGTILAELMYLKMQEDIFESHLLQNERARKLACACKSVVTIIVMVFICLVAVNYSLGPALLSSSSHIWYILSIVQMIIASISLVLTLRLTKEDRQEWYGTKVFLDEETEEQNLQGGRLLSEDQ